MSKPADLNPIGAELAALELFASADIEALAPMLKGCAVRNLVPGEVLISVGDQHHHLYLVLTGELSVRLEAIDRPPLIYVRAGGTIGEISVIDGKPASAFVVAECECRLLVVDEDLLWLLADSSHAVAYNLLHTLASRLRKGNVIIQAEQEQLRRFQYQASVDGLTGLFNRSWLDKMLARQMERARQNREPLSLLMLDVDHFKRFNDMHGHVAGDYALQSLANALRAGVRPTDMIARYGGEEFAVILPGAFAHDALPVAERVRHSVEQSPIPFADRPVLPPVTVSIGVATMDDDVAPEALIDAADRALYRAKRAGRNRVEAA